MNAPEPLAHLERDLPTTQRDVAALAAAASRRETDFLTALSTLAQSAAPIAQQSPEKRTFSASWAPFEL